MSDVKPATDADVGLTAAMCNETFARCQPNVVVNMVRGLVARIEADRAEIERLQKRFKKLARAARTLVNETGYSAIGSLDGPVFCKFCGHGAGSHERRCMIGNIEVALAGGGRAEGMGDLERGTLARERHHRLLPCPRCGGIASSVSFHGIGHPGAPQQPDAYRVQCFHFNDDCPTAVKIATLALARTVGGIVSLPDGGFLGGAAREALAGRGLGGLGRDEAAAARYAEVVALIERRRELVAERKAVRKDARSTRAPTPELDAAIWLRGHGVARRGCAHRTSERARSAAWLWRHDLAVRSSQAGFRPRKTPQISRGRKENPIDSPTGCR